MNNPLLRRRTGHLNTSSTNGHSAEIRLREFFTKYLVPVGESFSNKGIDGRNLTNDPVSTWVKSAVHEDKELFERERGECFRILRDMWENDELNELADLAPELFELAEYLEAIHTDSDEISSSMYIMY